MKALNTVITKGAVHCKIHGPYLSQKMVLCGKIIRTACPACLAEAEKTVVPMSRMIESGIGLHHSTRAIAAPTDPKAEAFIKSDKMFALIVGPIGTGKTQMAASIIRANIEAGSSTPMYITEYELLKACVHESFDSIRQSGVAAKFKTPSVLIIDEIGDIPINDMQAAAINDIIDRRWRSGKKTVLIGNIPPAELAQRLGERAADRIRSSLMTIRLTGPSLRAVSKESA